MDIVQLRYPVAYWDGTRPQHQISAVAIGHRFALTGALTGECVHWKVQIDNAEHGNDNSDDTDTDTSTDAANESASVVRGVRHFVADSLLLRVGGGRITAIVRCALSSSELFCVATSEGFISLWRGSGGRCIRSQLVTPFAPLHMLAYERAVAVRVGSSRRRSRVVTKTYIAVASPHSPNVYVVSLPHLRTVRVLHHDAEVVHIKLLHAPAHQRAKTQATSDVTAAPSASISAASVPTTPKSSAVPARPLLHCLTVGGAVYRWDIADLTSSDSLSITTAADTDDLSALTSKTPLNIVRLNVPNPLSRPIPATTTLRGAVQYLPVALSISHRGDFIVVALQRFIGVVAVSTSNLQSPLIDMAPFLADAGACVAGVSLLSPSTLSAVTLVVWTTDGAVSVISIHTAIDQNKQRKVVVRHRARLVSDEHTLRDGVVVVEEQRVVVATAAADLLDWIIPSSLITSPPPPSSAPFLPTPSYPSSPVVFQCAVDYDNADVIRPTSRDSLDAAFTLKTHSPTSSTPPPPLPSHQSFSFSSSPSPPPPPADTGDVCTRSVLISEQSGRTVLIARGFTSGHIRVYGPASRPALAHADAESLSVLSPRMSHTTTPTTVIDLVGHSASITAMLSIGGREFSCRHALLCSGSADGVVNVWDVTTAQRIQTFAIHSAVHSMHKPPLTTDDYVYANTAQATRTRANSEVLADSRLKETYHSSNDAMRGLSADIVVQEQVSFDGAHSDSSDTSSATTGRSLSADDSPLFSFGGGGFLFVCGDDLTVRVFSLTDFVLTAILRGHDAPVLAVFRDEQCVREEIVCIQTLCGSVFVWNTVDGALQSVMAADGSSSIGALSFLQSRGFVSPNSQLSILAMHLTAKERQRRRIADIPHDDADERKDAARGRMMRRLQAHHSQSVHTIATPAATFSTSAHSTNTYAQPIHTASLYALFHPQTRHLGAHDEAHQKFTHAVMRKTHSRDQLAHAHASPTSPSSTDDTVTLPSKPPTLSRHASSLGTDATTESRVKKSTPTLLSSTAAVPASTVPELDSLHIPMIDKNIGVKKLRNSIDLVNLQGKTHLHLSLFIVNLTKLIADLQRNYLYRTTDNATLLPPTPHYVSAHGLAAAVIDASAQDEFNYLLSVLFDWESASITSALLTEHFHIHAPHPRPSFAAITDNSQALTVLLPNVSRNFDRWKIDADITARHALAISAVCLPLLASVDVHRQMYFSKIVAHYNSILPSELRGFVDADVSVLALYTAHSNEHVHTSARLLLQGVIERASARRRSELLSEWSLFYTYPLPLPSMQQETPKARPLSPPALNGSKEILSLPSSPSAPVYGVGYVSDEELMTAVVISAIANAENAQTLDPASSSAADSAVRLEMSELLVSVSAHVANSLLRVLSWTHIAQSNDMVKCSLAADTLSRSIGGLHKHIADPQRLCHRLYLLSLANDVAVSASANRALLEVGPRRLREFY